MWALGVVAGMLAATTLTRYVVTRDNVPPMERRLRALDALRNLNEHPDLPHADIAPPPDLPSEHIRILSDEPDEPYPRRSAKSRRNDGTPNRWANEDRTVIEIRPLARERPLSPAIFDDASTNDAVSRVPRSRRLASRHSARRAAVAAPIAAACAAIAMVVGPSLGGDGHGNGSAARASADTAAPPTSIATKATSPPRTAPVEAAPVVARHNNGATISVRSPFRITLHASGRCWVKVSDATGRTLVVTTLQPGQEQLIPSAAPIDVALGYAPAVSISVDGVGLDLRGLSQTPNLSFQST